MKDYSSIEIQRAAEEVIRSELGDFMFRDPGCKRKSRHQRQANTSRIRHTSIMVTSRRVTSRQDISSLIQQTSVLATTRRAASNQANTFTRWDPNTQPNTFPWSESVPLRGTFCSSTNNNSSDGT